MRTVRTRHLTPEVAANFIDVLGNCPSIIQPASCDFITENFNSKLRYALDIVAPIKLKNIHTKSISPWHNEELKKHK